MKLKCPNLLKPLSTKIPQKILMLLHFRAIYFSTFQYETPCRQSQITVGKSNSPHCKYIPGAFEASMQLHAQFLVGESQVSPTVINNPETVQKGKFCPQYGQSSVMRVGSGTFGDPIFQNGLQN